MQNPQQNPQNNTQSNRRQFIQFFTFSALALLAVPLRGLFGEVIAAKADAPLPAGATAASESDPVASAIGYKMNVKDIDTTKYPQRKKPDAKNQNCKTCSLYTPVNDSWGKCQMITSGLVISHGWCGSWSKKT